MSHSYTAEERRNLRVRYRRIWIRQQIVGVVFLASAVAFGNAMRMDTVAGLSSSRVGPVAASVLLASFLYLFWNWRCPGCRFFLMRSYFATKCPRCKLSFSLFRGSGE